MALMSNCMMILAAIVVGIGNVTDLQKTRFSMLTSSQGLKVGGAGIKVESVLQT